MLSYLFLKLNSKLILKLFLRILQGAGKLCKYALKEIGIF